MRFSSQSAAVFLVAFLSFVACLPLITTGQELDPFGPTAKANTESNPFNRTAQAESNPFGSATKPPVQKAKTARTVMAPTQMPQNGPAEKATFSSKTLQSLRIRSKLNEKSDLIYDAEPFGDVLALLAENHKFNIVIDSNLAGILDEDTEVSANLAGVVIADGLRAMLWPVDATFTIKDGNLLIISIDDEGEPDYLTRHMIDVHGLLNLIKAAEADRIGKPVAPKAKPFLGGGKGGGGVFQIAPQAQTANPPQESPAPDKEEDKQSKHVELLTTEKILTDAITRIVASDSWMSNGSGNMDLTCVGGVLIVQASESVAGDVRSFVHDLEFQLKSRKE